MKRFSDQRGQTTIVMALSIFTLCGMAGLATDVGTLFRVKRVLQTAADSAALAAASEGKYGDDNATAIAVASLNGVTNGSNNYTVTESVIAAGYQVIASEAAPTFFMKLFSLNSMTVSATAVANNGPASGCIYALDPSGIDVGMSGSGTLNLPDCGIVINSASSNALDLSGSGSVKAQSVGIVGGSADTGSGKISPTPVTGIAPAQDPLAYLAAPDSSTYPACLANPSLNNSSSHTLGPATPGGTVCYNGITDSGSGGLTLQPGVYVINGAMSVSGSGSISGTGVTIYLAPPNGSLSLTGSGSLTLSAPTSGTYNGILFFEDSTDTNAMKVTGSGSAHLQGIFYAPDAALTLTGSGSGTIQADLVVHALSMSGSGSFGNYSSINPNEPLTSAHLVQ